MPKDAIPPLPPVPRKVDNETRNFMQAVKDNLQTRAGQTKNRWDYSPTVRELEQAGIITVVGGSGLGSGGPPLIIGPGGNTPFEDITVPEAPTGVIVRATPWYHHVTWDFPSEASNWITAYGEVWFSETNDRDTALLAGIAHNAFSMPVEPLAAYYYWVRYVSYANVNGYWSHGQFDGVYGESPPDPETLLDILTGKITEGELYQHLNDRIDWIDITDGGLIDRMTTAEGDLVTHTGLINSIDTRVTDNEGDITYNAQLITGLRTDLTDAEGDIQAHATSLTLHDTRITQNGEDITAEANRIDQVYVEIEHPTTGLDALYGGVQENASTIVSVEGDVVDIESKYSVKVDANGRVAGFGLISTDNGFGVGHSEFGVSADYFWIGPPAGPYEGDTPITFVVDTNKGRVVMDAAFIKSATISGAEIGDAAIDSAHIGDGTITSAKIENAAIVDAKIADEIRSYSLNLAAGQGWRIMKSGKIDAAEIVIYDENGDIILASGPTGATYHTDLDNKAQQYAQISGLPDSLETLAFMHASVGGFGNLTFDLNDHQDGYLQINGTTFYHPMGEKITIPSGQYLDTRIGAGRTGEAFFVLFNYYDADEIWTSWNYGNSTAKKFFLCTFNHETRLFSSYDHDGWVADFKAEIHSVIVATLRSKSSAIDTTTFTSMIGANLKLPDDYATQTGADNLLLDGSFYGSHTQGLDKFWGANNSGYGDVNVQNNITYGTYIQMPEDTSFAPANDDYFVPVIAGETIYFGVTYYLPGNMNNNLVVVALTHDNNKANPGYPTVIVLHDSQNPSYVWAEASGAYQVPNGVAFISTFVINYNTTEPVYIGALKMTRAPTEVSSLNAATYIRNAAIDTLQLAGQAVTFPRYFAVTYPPVSHQFWTTVLTTSSWTPSDASVPLGIHVSMTINPANSGVGGTSSSGKFRVLRRGTDNISGDVRIWYTSAANITYPGANNIDLIDTAHGGTSVHYVVQTIGEDGEPNDLQHCIVVSYEMKR